MEEIKPELTQRNDFWRHKSKLFTFLFQFVDWQDSDARLKVNDFANISNMAGVKFDIEILMEDIKLVLTFTDEYEYGNKLKQVLEFLDYKHSEPREKWLVI